MNSIIESDAENLDNPDLQTPALEQNASVAKRVWLDYRTVWRWHFYAGLFTIPFVIMLSITGGIYLFKTEYEAWRDAPCDHLSDVEHRATPAEQIQAACRAVPQGQFVSYELPQTATSSIRIVVKPTSNDSTEKKDSLETQRVYVHPANMQILKMFPDRKTFMRDIFRLHGELWLGNYGSYLVELAASWTIVMILTGLHLWWPRGQTSWGGILYPRMQLSQRLFWKDIHSVAGFWISGITLFLLISGLPWAKFWGNYFREVRKLTGTSSQQQLWSTGGEEKSTARSQSASTQEHADHGGSKKRTRQKGTAIPQNLNEMNRVVATVEPLQLAHPVIISYQGKKQDSLWDVKSMTPNRPWREELVVSGTTGEILSRKGFKDRHIIDQIQSTFIAAHEGRLFGWLNQLILLLAAMGLIQVSFSSLYMWWKRKPVGKLGAPPPSEIRAFSWSIIWLITLMGICLPMLGASLILIAIMDYTIFRIPHR